MIEMGWLEAAVAMAAMFLGATVFSATGFGIGMVSTPIMLLAHGPQSAIIVPGTLGMGVAVWIIWKSWRDVPFKQVVPIALAAVVGSPIGVYILSNADASVLSIVIAGFIILFAVGSFFKVERELPYSTPLGILAGFIVGVLLPTTGVAGSLVMLYLMTKNWERQTVRAAMAFFLMTLTTVAVVQFALAGLYTQERLMLISVAAIPALIGLALGAFIIKRINERAFQYAVIGIIIFSSLVAIAQELVNL
ncbi:MAG: sulfite exporter TauE/SafE family protein [Chloroflexi bacterium]|nr:sulfite exporter TauE/SafE family protein [Chloroflexota bacterium]